MPGVKHLLTCVKPGSVELDEAGRRSLCTRSTVTHASLTIIRHEHWALSAMLRSILLLLGDHRRRGTLPDFGALRAMRFLRRRVSREAAPPE